MRFLMFHYFSAAALSAVIPSYAWSADVRFAEAIQNLSDGGIVAEAGPGDVLVFDGGVFDTGGQPISILADTIRIDAATLILSHALDAVSPAKEGEAGKGSDGARGGTWGCRNETLPTPFGVFNIHRCELEGQRGEPGNTGATGQPGAAGPEIEIAFDEITGDASLVIIGNGQKGGQGQRGGQGGTGGMGENGQNRAGDIFCNRQNSRLNGSRGGDGGPAGIGGRGGEGGPGAPIIINVPAAANVTTTKAAEDEAEATYAFVELLMNGTYPEDDTPGVYVVSVGGQGGNGGVPGGRGAPGQGGNAGGGSHCGGGGQPGPPGDLGSEGGVGTRGTFGPPGEIEVMPRGE